MPDKRTTPTAANQGGELLTLPAAPRRINLHDSSSIRREMAAVYRDMRSGNIATQDGTRLGYMLNLLRQAHETELLEKRIEALEGLANADDDEKA